MGTWTRWVGFGSPTTPEVEGLGAVALRKVRGRTCLSPRLQVWFLVPNTITGMVLGIRSLKHWVLGPSGIIIGDLGTVHGVQERQEQPDS